MHHLHYISTECPDEWYGFDCKHQCSGHCRDNVPCNKVNGQCDKGCAHGYYVIILYHVNFVNINVLVTVLTMLHVTRRLVLVTEDVLLDGLALFVKKVIFHLFIKKNAQR